MRNAFRLTHLWVFCAALAIALLPVSLQAQQWITVTPEEAATHLIKKVEPEYPPFAKAAGIQGTVHIHIGISLDGRIGAIEEKTGPASLYEAAQAAVLQYVWKPFEKDGHPVAADTSVDVVFKLEGNVPSPPPPPAISWASFKTFEHFSRESGHPSWKCPDCILNPSPELRKWLSTELTRLYGDVPGGDISDCPSAQAALTALNDPNAELPVGLEGLEVIEVPVERPGAHLYLFRPHFSCMCGASGNCAIELIEEVSGGIRAVANLGGGAYSIQARAGSPLPDVFTYSHMSATEGTIVGYSNVDGMWGQLYCGEITWTGDQSKETDDVHVCQ